MLPFANMGLHQRPGSLCLHHCSVTEYYVHLSPVPSFLQTFCALTTYYFPFLRWVRPTARWLLDIPAALTAHLTRPLTGETPHGIRHCVVSMASWNIFTHRM